MFSLVDQPEQPFDAAAPTYDRDFTQSRLGVWLRGMVRRYIDFSPDSRVLELGCGTGNDALWLAWHGVRVTATDISPEMLSVTREKIAQAGMGGRVTVGHLDMNAPGDAFPGLRYDYDGVFANFGALNCVADRQQLAAFLAERVKRDGRVVLIVMGPRCPWEIGWYLLHGQPKTAFRRLRREPQYAKVGGDQTVPVWYPGPAQLRQEFATAFKHERTIGIGTLLPPTYLDHLVDRWPKAFRLAYSIDRRLGRFFPMPQLNDHYLMVLCRR